MAAPTTNFGFIKEDRFKDWLVSGHSNLDNIDLLLKTMTFAVGISGRLIAANNTGFSHRATNAGTGFDYQSPGTSDFNIANVNEVANAADLKLAPTGTVGTAFVFTFKVDTGRNIIQATNPIDILSSGEIVIKNLSFDTSGVRAIEKIGGVLQTLSLRGGLNANSGDIEFIPENDEVADGLTLDRVDNNGVKFIPFGFTNNRLAFGIDNTFFDSAGELTITEIQAPSGANDLTLRSGGSGQFVKMVDSGGNGIAIGANLVDSAATIAATGSSISLRLIPDDAIDTDFLDVQFISSKPRLVGSGTAITIKPDNANAEIMDIRRVAAGNISIDGPTILNLTPDNSNLTEFIKITRTASVVSLDGIVGGFSDNITIASDLRISKVLQFNGRLKSNTEILTGSGNAASLEISTSKFTSTGAGDTCSLANGTDGQIKFFMYTVQAAGADTVILTPASAIGFSTLTFTDIGDGAILQFDAGAAGWVILSTINAIVKA